MTDKQGTSNPLHAVLTSLSAVVSLFIVAHVVFVAQDVFNSVPIDECPFCLAANSTDLILLSTDSAYAIRETSPKCDEHYLVFPKAHIKNIDSEEATPEVIKSLEELCLLIFEQLPEDLERKMLINRPPYYNVKHLHLHCMGCAPASWLSYQKLYLALHQ